MAKQHNWVGESVTGTPGTGTITLGGATFGHIQFEDAYTTGDLVHYAIADGGNREIGIGTLTTGTPWTLARTTILETLVSGTYDDTSPTAITLTSAALVSVNAVVDMPGTIVGSEVTYNSTNSSPAGTISTSGIPVNTDGVEFMIVEYTPKYADSVLRIKVGFGSVNTTDAVIGGLAVFRDSTVNAIASISLGYVNTSGGSGTRSSFTEIEENAVSTSLTTFKVRVGSDTGAAISINSHYGASINTFIKVEEIRQ